MPNIVCSSPRIAEEVMDLVPRLHEVFLDLKALWPREIMRITCIYRTEAEEQAAGGKSGIHTQGPPYRAVDVGAREYSPTEIKDLSDQLNQAWQYDPERPALLVCFSEPHGTGPHFHLQVHPNTRRRSE